MAQEYNSTARDTLCLQHFAHIAALTRFSLYRQHPKVAITYARSSRSHNHDSKVPELALCVSLSSASAAAFSRSLKTTPPRRAAESTMRRQSLCQASHQHRKHAIIFICFLSAAHSNSTLQCIHMQRRFARRQKVIERDSFGQIGAQGVVNQLFGIQSAARVLGARRCATGPRRHTHTHMLFALSTVHARFDDQRRPGLVLMLVTSSNDAPSPLLFILPQ
jgi:hypothetical protein